MEEIKNNIKKLRLSRGLTQTQLSEVVGAKTYTTVSKWESGENTPHGKDLIVLSKFFNVSVDYILGIENQANKETYYEYNCFPTAISAGLPINVDGITNDQVEKISISDNIMGKWAGNKNIFITKICGDSMDKIMPDGSLIAVKPIAQNELKDGDIVVFSDNHEYSVKYYHKHPDKLVFKPKSYNKEHHDQPYRLDENIRIHGKVVLYIVNMD